MPTMFMVAIGGIAASAGTYWLFRRLSANLAALALWFGLASFANAQPRLPARLDDAAFWSLFVELSEPVRRKLDYISNPRGARPHIERLAKHRPEVMACMHGSAWRGDGARLLNRYADALES